MARRKSPNAPEACRPPRRRLSWRHWQGGGMGNHLYYGDNLKVLRDSIASESVDLI
jgi:hypothetical protein